MRLTNLTICLTGASIGLFSGLFFLRDFIFTPGFPRYWDLTWWYSSHQYPLFYLWDEFIQAPVIINRMIAFLPLSIFSAEASERILYLFIFTMMGMSMFFATFKLTAARHKTARVPFIAGILATLLFIMNPVVCTSIWHWQVLWFYAFMPLLFYFAYTAFSRVNTLRTRDFLKWAILIALVLSIMAAEPRMPIYFPLLVPAFLAGFSRPSWSYLKRSAILVALVLGLYAVFSAFWLIPIALGADSTPYWYVNTRGYVQAASENSHSTLSNVITLQAKVGSFFKYTYWHSGIYEGLWKASVIIVPVIAFGSLLLRRSKLIIWLALFALAFIFLGKGTNWPFGNFYEWLAFDSPVISNFGYQLRKPFMWHLPLMFCYAMLFGLSISYFLGWIRDRKWRKKLRMSLLTVFVIIAAVIPLGAGYPLFTGDLNGTMKSQEMATKWVNFHEWMGQDDSDCKIIYCPTPPRLGSPKPTTPHYYSGTRPSHNPTLPILLLRSLARERTTRFGELNSPWNAKYVAVASSAHRVPQDDLEFVQKFGDIDIFENQADISHIETTAQSAIVFGGLENTLSLTAIDAYDMVDSSLIFADQLVSNGAYLSSADILLANLGNLDVYLSQVEEEYIIEAMAAIDDYREKPSWGKATAEDVKFADWHYFLHYNDMENWQYDYGKGFAHSNGRAYLDIPFNVDSGGMYDIVVRCFMNEKGGETRILLDNEVAKDVPTKSQLNQFVWKKVGTFHLAEGKHVLTLEQRVSGWNTVNLLAVLPQGELERYKDQTDTIISDKRIIHLWEAETALNSSMANVSGEYGVDASYGRVLSLPSGSRAWRDVDILRDGNYKLAVRLSGSATVGIDAQQFTVSSSDLGFVYLSPINLKEGKHTIEIVPSGPRPDLDVVWLYSIEDDGETIEDIFTAGGSAAQLIDYERIDRTKYRATVDADGPFMLSFAEAYDRLWVASVNGREYPGLPLNSVVNGFWIQDEGELEITIEFKSQRWFYYGATITGIGILGAFGFLMWNWRRRRGLRRAEG